jgi:hypothetical protein
MTTYTLKLKGTKKNNTDTISVTILANNKSQAFNMAYVFFQKGETNTIFGRKETGLTTFNDWIIGANDLVHLAGKYKVYMSQITRN